ncbi:MAG TPA: hypothetical protein VGS07_31945 [Thermoanaerobaculia bacterium]|nr:hypothetical protein [Thermoanaerobaculia bacterium]
MKITGVVRLSLLLLLTLAPEIALAQTVKCDRFEPRTILEGHHLLVSLDTDLPDSTVLMVGVSRSYWAGHPLQEYPIEYLDTHSTVGEWRKPRRVDLDNAAWKAKLDDSLKYLAQMGKPIHITKLDKSVAVSFVVPINQSDPRFGTRNQNLVGRKMSTSTSGLRIVTAEVKVAYAISKVALASSIDYGDPENLRRGVRYRLSRETPLAAELHPADPLRAASSMGRLSAGTVITVLAVDGSELPHTWYRVRASTTLGARLGWVNGLALIGQQLIVVAQ